jgi:integrase
LAALTPDASPPDCTFSTQAGKISRESPSSQDAGTSSQIPTCPNCNSSKVWKDGLRNALFGDPIQRWLCRDCGHRFSDPAGVKNAKEAFQRVSTIESNTLKTPYDIVTSCQICVSETKNLVAEQKQTLEVPQRTEADLNGAVVDFLWNLKRQNYAEDTLNSYGYNLQELVTLGVNLFDPQSFIDKMTEIGNEKTNVRKYNLAKAYKCFLNFKKIEAKLPKYRFKRPLPYVPPEKFLDQLITFALSDQMSIFLQTLKETGARPGEAFRLEWNDIDITGKTINISHPEKGCNPRILPISDNLIKALLALPHAKKNLIFNYKNKHACSQSFRRMRKRAAIRNPELLKIDFYTYRYWRATEEYDRSHKDYDAVMYLLGHNSLRYVLLYKQLSKARRYGRGEEYIVREAKNKKEAMSLLSDGFDYVMDKGGASLFRKLK